MTREGWRQAVIEAMDRHDEGDDRFLNLIADLLTDEDMSERVLFLADENLVPQSDTREHMLESLLEVEITFI